MNGKRDHVSSVAARARVSDKSGLFHCISAHQGYKRDPRNTRPSQIIKNEISLATYSDLDAKVSFGTLVEPLWLPLGAPRISLDLPKSVNHYILIRVALPQKSLLFHFLFDQLSMHGWLLVALSRGRHFRQQRFRFVRKKKWRRKVNVQ